jgi:hypothetical protein
VRAKSPPPSARNAAPITTTSTSPPSSISVQPTLKRTDSLMPRKLISAIANTNAMPTRTVGSSTNADR